MTAETENEVQQQVFLVVDDDPDYLLLAGNLLRNEGLSVQTATSGEEALEYMGHQAFHLLMTDYHMPGMDGLTLARMAATVAPDMAIIMCSGSISPDLPTMAEAAGVGRVLSKPFHPGELLAAVREAAGARRGRNRVDKEGKE